MTAAPLRVVVGVGSNLGDRAALLDAGVAAVAASPGVRLVARAGTYESAPAGGPPQGDYLNTAALLAVDVAPRALLEALLAIERQHGRVRPDAVRNAPRTLDLDVLWIEGCVVAEPGLEVPHPRLVERAFALVPLLDLVPDAEDPRDGSRFAERAVDRGSLRRVAAPPDHS